MSTGDSYRTTRSVKPPLKGLSKKSPKCDRTINKKTNSKVVHCEESCDIDEDEESQIDSSMPCYLDCIYGNSLSFSQEVSATVPQGIRCPELSKHSKKTSIFTLDQSILQSQGFDTVGSKTQIPNSSERALSSNIARTGNSSDEKLIIEESPLLLHAQNSPTIDPLECNPQSDPLECCTNNDKSIESHIHSVLKRKNTNTCDELVVRKKKRVSDGPVYEPPSCCIALGDCVRPNTTVNILALVLQVNSPMMVKCKRGQVAGQTVLMSSVLLADPTKSYFKLSLWREAADWSERIAVGDIVFLKTIRLKSWSHEVVGTTIKHSSVLNLHQPKLKLPQKVQSCIPVSCLSNLMEWGRKNFTYIFSSCSEPRSQREVQFHTFLELRGNLLVHIRAKLLCIVSSRVVLMADSPDVNIHIHLWCDKSQYLTDGTYTLQTTSRSTLTKLSGSCSVAVNIAQRFPCEDTGGNWIMSCQSIGHMMTLRQSGIVKVSGSALKLEFLLPEDKRLHLNLSEKASWLCQAVYVGCETCASSLPQDENGIYCQCLPCISKSPGRGYPNSAYFFRPLMVTLQDSLDSDITVSVYASHVATPKVIGCTAKEVVQASILESHLDLKTSPASWVIQCSLIKDENSFIEERSFTLIDVCK